MARTPLFAQLQRHFRLLQSAEALGVSPEALIERTADGLHSPRRRQVLAGLGAATALGALPAWARRSAPSIVIVGAGMAGLNCALTLHDAGLPFTLYEAAGRVGGRMFSLEHGYWAQNQVSEWCGELIDSGHTTIQKLARRFGLTLDDMLAAEPRGSEDTYRFFGRYYRQAEARRDFQAIYASLKADLEAAPFPTTYKMASAKARELDAMSVADYLTTRIPDGLNSPLGALLAAAYAPEYAADIEDQSALNLLYLLASQPRKDGFAIFGESDEHFHIRGGNEQLPKAVARALPQGSLQLGQKLVKLARTAAGTSVLSFEDGTRAHEVRADLVVLALPFATLANVDLSQASFTELKLEAIREQGRGRSGKTQLQFSSRLWNGRGAWPGVANGATYSDAGYQSSWEVSRGQAGSMGILNLFSGGSASGSLSCRNPFATANNSEALADARTQLGRVELVFPGLSKHWNGLAAQSLPHLSPYFGLSYSYYRVGQYTAFAGYEAKPQEGVYFCGEHCSTEAAGYMEGAAETGGRVGKALLRLAA